MEKNNHPKTHHEISFLETLYALLALFFLTVITVVVSLFDFGVFNGVVALFIASMKASVVLAIFMGLRKGSRFFLLIILSSVFFVILLLAFNWIDIFSRAIEKSTL